MPQDQYGNTIDCWGEMYSYEYDYEDDDILEYWWNIGHSVTVANNTEIYCEYLYSELYYSFTDNNSCEWEVYYINIPEGYIPKDIKSITINRLLVRYISNYFLSKFTISFDRILIYKFRTVSYLWHY